MSKGILLISTVSSEEDAEKIARHLVERKFAACVNVIPKITSFYFWQGKLQKDSELLLLIKTIKDMEEMIIDEVKRIHPYQVPEVLSFDIENGLEEYINWMMSSVSHENRGK
ncbi:divalent-cation tolerance protein CutA [Sulfuracidifex tepidarius]|uniref:Divalent-cation tolerance protein CutA n=1 Tax=Sulfuracidifex tepidarius TaxID=1294262 RepID=A0A510E2A6_9CREN|nr:divalent-cation tolerance protein CutA [Sulfuracidifex tepidarius]BBG23871.1 Divalent-cation tolerance protein CutA [Sulfuracidifex tepidarius]BBG26626.1 Divalent-cation tolerance protein CutA [Sulfuracidifex tepidarius]